MFNILPKNECNDDDHFDNELCDYAQVFCSVAHAVLSVDLLRYFFMLVAWNNKISVNKLCVFFLSLIPLCISIFVNSNLWSTGISCFLSHDSEKSGIFCSDKKLRGGHTIEEFCSFLFATHTQTHQINNNNNHFLFLYLSTVISSVPQSRNLSKTSQIFIFINIFPVACTGSDQCLRSASGKIWTDGFHCGTHTPTTTNAICMEIVDIEKAL